MSIHYNGNVINFKLQKYYFEILMTLDFVKKYIWINHFYCIIKLNEIDTKLNFWLEKIIPNIIT